MTRTSLGGEEKDGVPLCDILCTSELQFCYSQIDESLGTLMKSSRFLWKMLSPVKRLRLLISAAKAPAMRTISGGFST